MLIQKIMFVATLAVVAFCVGCGAGIHPESQRTDLRDYHKICLDGVQYWQYGRGYEGGLSPVLTTDSKIVPCGSLHFPDQIVS